MNLRFFNSFGQSKKVLRLDRGGRHQDEVQHKARLDRSECIYFQFNGLLITIYLHVNSVDQSSLQLVKTVHLHKRERHLCLQVNMRIHVKDGML